MLLPGTLPSQWEAEDPRQLITVLDVIAEQRQKEAQNRG